MTTYLVSLFDINYATRALALYKSARKNVPDCAFYFLCLDNESKALFQGLKLPNLSIHVVDDLRNKALEGTRKDRTKGEFAFTAKSNYLAFLVDTGKFKDGDIVIWADADILFYSSAQALIEDTLRKHSIIITPHKFGPKREHIAARVGAYNAGMIFFTMDESSRKCIREWAAQCIEWCFNRFEDGKLGDQMYLDAWHARYQGVHDLMDKGVNAGTWNILEYSVRPADQGGFTLDGEPLVCYHFHGLKAYLQEPEKVRPYPICVYDDGIYKKYAEALAVAYSDVRKIHPGFSAGMAPKPSWLRLIKQAVQKNIRNLFRN